jgi:hypothetical protein
MRETKLVRKTELVRKVKLKRQHRRPNAAVGDAAEGAKQLA